MLACAKMCQIDQMVLAHPWLCGVSVQHADILHCEHEFDWRAMGYPVVEWRHRPDGTTEERYRHPVSVDLHVSEYGVVTPMVIRYDGEPCEVEGVFNYSHSESRETFVVKVRGGATPKLLWREGGVYYVLGKADS